MRRIPLEKLCVNLDLACELDTGTTRLLAPEAAAGCYTASFTASRGLELAPLFATKLNRAL